jgi:hypothetical protein
MRPNEQLFWALIYTWRQNLYTGNICLSKFSKESSVKLKNGADFFNGVQVGVEILTSKIRHENVDKFKNGLSKKGVE